MPHSPLHDSGTSIANSARTRFEILEPLRGVAALWVFTFHYSFSPAVQENLPWGITLFKHGHLGVSMFFVISGYCLMAALRASQRRADPPLRFLKRRARRIYPPYWASLVVVACLPFVIEGLSALKTGNFVAPSGETNPNFAFLNYSLLEWFRVATLSQVFAQAGNGVDLQSKFTGINAVYWTLAIEFQFYLVMTLALAAGDRANSVLTGVTFVALICILSGQLEATGVFFPYWPMFAVGLVLYIALERGHRWPPPFQVAGVLSLTTLILGTVIGAAVLLRPAPISELSFAIAFALWLWALRRFDGFYTTTLGEQSPGGVALRVGRILGLMSYSLYLLHGRLQFLAHQIGRQVLPAGFLLDAVAILTTCGMAFGFYWWCERPFTTTGTTRA